MASTLRGDAPVPCVFAETADLEKTASAIAAKLGERKERFVIAGDGEDADIVVRVLELQAQRYMGSACTPEPTSEDRMLMRTDVEEVSHLEAEVVIGEEPPLLLKASGARAGKTRSPSS